MKGRFLNDPVVVEGAPVLQLLARKDQALLVRRDALLVLDFLFDVVDGVRRLDVQRDGLARQRLDEDLRARAVLVGSDGARVPYRLSTTLSRRTAAVGARGDGVRALSLRIAALSRHRSRIAYSSYSACLPQWCVSQRVRLRSFVEGVLELTCMVNWPSLASEMPNELGFTVDKIFFISTKRVFQYL